jgi:hypothetical protein
MTILVLAGVAVVAVAVLFLVPLRHAESEAREFPWRWRMRVGTPTWVGRRSKRLPSGNIRYVVMYNDENPKKRYYSYEKRVWRNIRSIETSGWSQDTVRSPQYQLRNGEEVRRERQSYKAKFASEDGRYYLAKIRLEKWKSLEKGRAYRLGRNTFGSVRTVKPVAAIGQGGAEGERPE